MDSHYPSIVSSSSSLSSNHVVIVGAGIAGLTCARTLLQNDANVKVTLVEASSQIGGRIQADFDFCPGFALDVGAEYIHGTNTILTDTIQEFRQKGLLVPASSPPPTSHKQPKKKQATTTIDTPLSPTQTKRHGKSAFVPVLHLNKKEHVDAAAASATATAKNENGIPTTIVTQQSSVIDPLDDFFEEIFITAHADGGPSETPTQLHGMHGMYFVNDQLVVYNDPVTSPLVEALEDILEPRPHYANPQVSIHQALHTSTIKLSQPLYHLGLAGYGNTAACTNLQDLSLHMLQRYETHWEENEHHGDYRLPPTLGMYSVVQALGTELEHDYDGRFTLLLNRPVLDVAPCENNHHHCRLEVTLRQEFGHELSDPLLLEESTKESTQSSLMADHVVVAVPAPMLTKVMPSLLGSKQLSTAAQTKLEALEYVGFSNIIKIVCKFSQRLWPEKLQSIVSAQGLFPELWFRSNFGPNEHLVVFYLSDDYAQEFVNECRLDLNENGERVATNQQHLEDFPWNKARASQLCMEHLSTVLSLEMAELQSKFTSVLVHDWKYDQEWIGGGHSYPRVGMKVDHLHALAAPMCDNRVHFCGEATNTNAACTVQAAMETGVRAAHEVISSGGQGGELAFKNTKGTQQLQNQDTAAPDSQQGTESNISGLIRQQMQVSRSLAQHEESSFAMLQSLERKQVEMSRTMLVQEETSFQMIQALEQMQERNLKLQKDKDLAAQRQDRLRVELESMHLEGQQLTEQHQQQAQAIEVLQSQVTSLSEALEEKDSMLHSRDQEISSLAQQVASLSQDLKKERNRKDAMVKSRDAIIKIMAQKQKSAATRADQALAQAEAAESMTKDRDAVIRIMAQKVQALTQKNKKLLLQTKAAAASKDDSSFSTASTTMSPYSSPERPSREQSLKQVKVQREEKLQKIMTRIRNNSTSRSTNTSVAQAPNVHKDYSKRNSTSKRNSKSDTPMSRASATSTASTVSIRSMDSDRLF